MLQVKFWMLFAIGLAVSVAADGAFAQNRAGNPMTEPIVVQPIGVIHSPYREAKGTPIQGVFGDEVDVLDGTPVLDIKPYVRQFDARPDARSGWAEKHFEDGHRPENTRAR